MTADRFDRLDRNPALERNAPPPERPTPRRDQGTTFLPTSRRYTPTGCQLDDATTIRCASCPATLDTFTRNRQARHVELEAAGWRAVLRSRGGLGHLQCAKCVAKGRR